MPWFPLDTHYYQDPKIEAAGAMTPFAMSVFPMLLADAKQRADGGKVEVSYRKVSNSLFISEEEARKAIAALVEVGVLEAVSAPVPACPQLSEGSIRLVFPAWRRWNERFRKASQREVKAA